MCGHPTKADAALFVGIESTKQLSLPCDGRFSQNVLVGDPREVKNTSFVLDYFPQLFSAQVAELHARFLIGADENRMRFDFVPAHSIPWIVNPGISALDELNPYVAGPSAAAVLNDQRDGKTIGLLRGRRIGSAGDLKIDISAQLPFCGPFCVSQGLLGGGPHFLAGPPQRQSEQSDCESSQRGNSAAMKVNEVAERDRHFISGTILIFGMVALAVIAIWAEPQRRNSDQQDRQ